MQRYIYPLLLTMAIAACKSPEKKEAETSSETPAAPVAPVTLTLKWETDTVLTTCESVLYDKDQDVLYVSNIAGAPDGKDGNGFISTVSLDGKVIAQHWARGMDAPKGLGLHNGKLFVTDIDRVHEVDTKTGKITKTHPVKGAVFLNDIAVDDNGKVYVSDSRGGTVYTIENGKLATWMKDLPGPNGLHAANGPVLMAFWDEKTLNTVEAATSEITMRTDSLDNPDGIEAIGNNEYFVSSWNGMVHHVDANWKRTLVLDTRSAELNAADIEYIQDKKLLLVPTFFKNKVMAYEVSGN